MQISVISEQDNFFLKKAIELSEESINEGGYPIGAVLVKDNSIIGEGKSIGDLLHDTTLHAEIDGIRNTSKFLETKFLDNCTLYSSCEPCRMCFSACSWARIPKIIYTLKKELLPKDFFDSEESIEQLNEYTFKKIELIYIKELENEALKVVEKWITKNKYENKN